MSLKRLTKLQIAELASDLDIEYVISITCCFCDLHFVHAMLLF